MFSNIVDLPSNLIAKTASPGPEVRFISRYHGNSLKLHDKQGKRDFEISPGEIVPAFSPPAPKFKYF